MSAEDVTRALRNPGKLWVNPTTFWPTPDGTELGTVRDVEIEWNVRTIPIVAEEFGERVQTARTAQFPRLAFTLEQWDPDVISRVFSSVTTSSSPSGLPGISRINGNARPGLVSAVDPILFRALDPKHPCVLIHRPVPVVLGTTRFAIEEHMTLFLAFDATRASDDDVYQVDLLEHLAL